MDARTIAMNQIKPLMDQFVTAKNAATECYNDKVTKLEETIAQMHTLKNNTTKTLQEMDSYIESTDDEEKVMFAKVREYKNQLDNNISELTALNLTSQSELISHLTTIIPILKALLNHLPVLESYKPPVRNTNVCLERHVADMLIDTTTSVANDHTIATIKAFQASKKDLDTHVKQYANECQVFKTNKATVLRNIAIEMEKNAEIFSLLDEVEVNAPAVPVVAANKSQVRVSANPLPTAQRSAPAAVFKFSADNNNPPPIPANKPKISADNAQRIVPLQPIPVNQPRPAVRR